MNFIKRKLKSHNLLLLFLISQIKISPYNLIASSSLNKRVVKICYFSLNNDREFEELRKLSQEINKVSDIKLEVVEKMPLEENPEVAFEKMVAQMSARNEPFCDFLIISGHHAGFWEGKRSGGKLSLTFLEKISCDPRYSDWFSAINTLWLQGCRTIRTGEKDLNESVSQSVHNLAPRMGGFHIEADITALGEGYSFIMDTDDPLSFRYSRIFDQATILGWKGNAPSGGSKSQDSLPLHIFHLAKINDKNSIEEDIAGNIDKQKLNEALLKDSIEKLYEITTRQSPRICSDELIASWLKQSKKWDQNVPLGIHPLDLNENRDALKIAKEYNCLFINSTNEKEILKAIDDIVNDPNLLKYSFKSIISFLNKLETTRHPLSYMKQSILSTLRNSPNIPKFIESKLKSNQSIFVKSEFYQLAKDPKYYLTDLITIPEGFETKLKELAKKEINWTDKDVRTDDLTYYKMMIMQSICKIGLCNDLNLINELINMVKTKNLEPYGVLNEILKNIHTFKFTNSEKINLIKKIASFRDERTYDKIIVAIASLLKKDSKLKLDPFLETLNITLVKDLDPITFKVLTEILINIHSSETLSPEKKLNLIYKIMNHPNRNEFTYDSIIISAYNLYTKKQINFDSTLNIINEIIKNRPEARAQFYIIRLVEHMLNEGNSKNKDLIPALRQIENSKPISQAIKTTPEETNLLRENKTRARKLREKIELN